MFFRCAFVDKPLVDIRREDAGHHVVLRIERRHRGRKHRRDHYAHQAGRQQHTRNGDVGHFFIGQVGHDDAARDGRHQKNKGRNHKQGRREVADLTGLAFVAHRIEPLNERPVFIVFDDYDDIIHAQPEKLAFGTVEPGYVLRQFLGDDRETTHVIEREPEEHERDEQQDNELNRAHDGHRPQAAVQ